MIGVLMVLLAIMAISCFKKVNVEKVSSLANNAFQTKHYDQFNKQYSVLQNADQAMAEALLTRIKQDDVFKIEKISSIQSAADRLKELENINKQVPELTSYSEKLINELKAELKEYSMMVNHFDQMLQARLVKIKDPFSSFNQDLKMMNEDTIEKAIADLKELSTTMNEEIMTMESLPFQDKDMPEYFENMRLHNICVASKMTYLEGIKYKVILANTGVAEDIEGGKFVLYTDYLRLQNNLIIKSLTVVKQRSELYKKEFSSYNFTLD
ncbi:hypothetical protein ACFQZE_15640 [Paenibacillus sp. GCM10027627]